MFSSSRKPRFNLDLSIHEISNIPQVSGYCYVDVQVRDGKKRRTRLLPRPSSNNDVDGKSSSALSLDKPEGLHTSSDVTSSTPLRKIHNFKCTFNYNMNCNLKFSLEKKDNRISSKYLVMKVYYISDEDVKTKDGDNITTHSRQKTKLGKLELNLSEYINIEEPLNSKYLMSDSKVNSILNLTIFLSELPEDFDFHTQLRVNDVGGHTTTSSTFNQATKKVQNRIPQNKLTKYNAPNLERKKIFGGLNDVIKTSEASPTLANLSASSMPSDDSDKHAQTKNKPSVLHKVGTNPDDESIVSNQRSNGDEATASNAFNGGNAINKPNSANGANVMMDPIVSNLYKKILECTWDPELHGLLEFTPEDCIADIFENGGDGWNKYISQTFGKWSDENNYDDNIDEVNGLVNEATFREDLRSWTINDSRP